MAISYVGAAGWTDFLDNDDFTINKPSGVVSGDIMIAAVNFYAGPSGSQQTVNAPSGWTKVRDLYAGGSWPNQLTIFKRTAGGSEPSSWAGTLGGNEWPKATTCVAYRGADPVSLQFVAENGTNAGLTNSYSTPTVNNNTSGSWSIVIGGYTSGSISYGLSSNESNVRDTRSVVDGPNATYIRAWDSGGPISTGNRSRTQSRTYNWSSASAWIGIIKPLSSPPSSGTMAVVGPIPVSDLTTVADNPGVLAGTGPMATHAGWYGYPHIPAVGTLDAVGPAAAHGEWVVGAPVFGTLDAVAPLPVSDLRVDTRPFGPRVIHVLRENRTLRVPNVTQ